MQPVQLIKELDKVFVEANIQHPYFQSWWNDLKEVVENELSSMTSIRVHTLYTMDTKKGQVTVICTKENSKTWVMYEVEGSRRPGCRWMLGKSWCTEDNIQRSIAQSYAMPVGIKFK